MGVSVGEKRTGILITSIHKIGIDKGFNFYQGQGRKFKGQGQIRILNKTFNELLIKNRKSDFDYTHIEC